MPTNHPDYPGYKIYWEKLKEKPVGGHFYAQDGKTLYPYHKHTLSWYAKYGCGALHRWKVINMNVWNRKHLVYRETSTYCKSPKVSSDKALMTFDPGGKGAFIALCENDRSARDTELGSLFQVIYVPKECQTTGMIEDPDDVKPKIDVKIAPNIPKIINVPIYNPTTIIKTIPDKIITPTVPNNTPTGPTVGPFGPGVTPGGKETQKEISYPPTYPPGGIDDGDGGIPWWLWLVLLVLGGSAGVVAYKKSKKGKKGKKGKKKRKKR